MLPFDTPLGPIALTVVGVLAVWGGFELRDRARRMTAWPSVRGRITSSALVKDSDPMLDGSPAYYPRIRYAYVVAGREYCGQRRALINVGVGAALRGEARRVLGRYPVGSEVTVFYDPANPSEAILERPGPVAGPTLLFVLGAALVVAGQLWSWWGKQ